MGFIKAYIESIADLNEHDWLLISDYFERCELPKGKRLIKTGEVERYLSFIEEGVVRNYIPGIENDLTFGFSFEKEFTCAYDSFLTQQPSSYEQETLTKCTIWRISYNNLQRVYRETAVGNHWGRYAAEKLFLTKINREISLLNQTAKQRYLDLLSSKSNIVRTIPLKYVASYIGITPQSLSRIRREIS